jgi:putative protease
MTAIELLSPAKNLECGIAAINHGADAVYIGANQFGARAAAGNSIADIETLINYAHRYRSKVYVAFNTVLTDDQLNDAERSIHEIYNAGADALIVQDMGILCMNIPPIELHASTQTDNRTIEKVQFLEKVGFSRVVLARELNLKQIADISQNTKVQIEAFVHGALCVSYSGQCYISEAMSGRSANRGQCAQYCRLPYTLEDNEGNILVRNKHLLSMKDLNLSESLLEMMEAGVMSLKIEGRLKEVDYVKNITSYYRKKLDAILDNNRKFQKASFGKTTLFFEPNPEKSFQRGSTDYFLHGRHTNIYQPNTPKSMGEPIGKVLDIKGNYFKVTSAEKLSNGDGLCFINQHGDLTGFRVNRVEGGRVFPAEMPKIKLDTLLYRNQDQAFDKIISGKTSERKIALDMLMSELPFGFSFRLTDEEGISISMNFELEKQLAQKPETVFDNIRQQLSKLGNSIYQAQTIDIDFTNPWFIPSSFLADCRRKAVDKLDELRNNSYKRSTRIAELDADFPQKQLTYLGNVTNKLAHKFYQQHGVEDIKAGFEVKAAAGVPLMFTKHCIKYELGWCPREGYKAEFKEPLFLINNSQKYRVRFDCQKCEMEIFGE